MLKTNQIGNLYSSSEKHTLVQYMNEAIEQRGLTQEKEQEWLHQLNEGVPYQYILNEAHFYGLTLYVDNNVLIPRPETEELVEKALAFHPNMVLDLCSGSGCIALAIKHKLPKAEVTGLEWSEQALNVAKNNSEKLGLNVNWILDDMLNPVASYGSYDMIVSNPPYVGEEEQLSSQVHEHEPHMALYSPGDDMKFYKKLKYWYQNHLADNGILLAEINQEKGDETASIFSDYNAEILEDMSGNKRFLLLKK